MGRASEGIRYRSLNPPDPVPSLAPVIRALDTLSFGLCLLGWLLLGVFGTWEKTAPFWIGAPLLWAAALCGLFTLHWGLRGKLSRPCMVSVIVFIGWVTWRALRSDVSYLARQDIVFGATAFIGWVLTAVRYEKPRHRFALIVVWALLILGNLGMGLYQKYGHPEANPLSFLGFTRDFRDAVFGGFFPNSNHLCGFLELTAFPLLAIAVFGRVHSFVRVLCGLVFVAACVCVALSTSRGGFLVFGLGIALFGALAAVFHILRKSRFGGRWQATGLLFAGMAILCGAIGWIAWGQLETKFGEGKVFANLNSRTELWDRAHAQWMESPITGTGARSFEYYERSFRNMGTKWITWSEADVDAIFAHNDWVQTLADYGLAGLLLAAAVLALHCWKALSFLLADSHESAAQGGGFFTDYRGAIVMGAFCGMIPFAIHCVADFHMHIGVNAVLAASVLGLMANPGRPASGNGEAKPASGARRGWKVTATLAAAVPAAVLAWCAPLWAVGDYHLQRGLGIFSHGADSLEDSFTALARMKLSVEADPKNYDAWFHWGHANSLSFELLKAELPAGEENDKLQFLHKALDAYRKAHSLYPQHPDISATVARTLDRLRRFEEAEQWFHKALRWGDGSRLIHEWYADHLMATGRYQEAVDHYWPALHRHDDRRREGIQKKLERCLELLKKQREGAREIKGRPNGVSEEQMKLAGPMPEVRSGGVIPVMLESLQSAKLTELKAENITSWGKLKCEEIEGMVYWTATVQCSIENPLFGPQPTEVTALMKDNKVVKWLYTASRQPVR